jgi:acetylornithine/succinyldiaminopimelate/putrescine aminotransferase
MEFFSTFGGNPMAMTATNAALDVIDWQKLQQNAFETGKYLNRRLKD